MKSFNASSKISSNRANAVVQRVGEPTKTIVDNRSTAIAQRKLQKAANQNHRQVLQLNKAQVIQRMLTELPPELIEQVVDYTKNSEDRNNVRLVNSKLAQSVSSINELLEVAETKFDRGLSTGQIKDWLSSKGVPTEVILTWAWNVVKTRKLPYDNDTIVDIYAFRIPPKEGDANYVDLNASASIVYPAPANPAPVAPAPANPAPIAPANTCCGCSCTIL